MRLLTLSDFSHRDQQSQQSGFGRQHKAILSFLHSKGHEVFEVGVGFTGQYLQNPPPWQLLSPTAYGRMEGQDAVPMLANLLEVDGVFLLADVPDVAYVGDPIRYRDRRTGQGLKEDILGHFDAAYWKKIAYTVIDGACPNDHLPKEWESAFRGFDGLAFATKWARDIVEKEFGIRGEYLPHTVDTNHFKPADKTLARKQFNIDPEAFVILWAGVNRRRKMIPNAFEAVAKFAKRTKEKKILFWIHSYKAPDMPGYDLQALADHYDLRKYNAMVILTENLPEAAMPLFYATGDILLHTSGGEGFGLVPLEAAACRLPAFVTDYTGQNEQVTDAMNNFLRVPVRALIPQEGNVISWAWADTDILAERLESYWAEKPLRTKLKRASFEWAQKFKPDVILPKMEAWLDTVLKEDKERRALTVDVL